MNGKMVAVIGGSVLVLCLCVAVCAGVFLVTQNVGGLANRFLPNELQTAKATLDAVATTAPSIGTTSSRGTTVPSQKVATATPRAGSSSSASSSAATAASGNILGDSIGKVKSATKFRLQFSFLVGSTESGKYQEQPLMDLTGEVDNGRAHMTSKGGLMAMLTGDENGTLEIIEADGKTYMRGVSLFGMTDPKLWYLSDDSSTSGFADMAKPDSLNSWVSDSDLKNFKKVRSETLDNQSCDVYLYDTKSLGNAAILSMLGSSGNGNDMSAIDKGEMSFWLCRDGLVHQFLLDYQGHDSKDATQKGALKISWHAWDFGNSAISVTAPKDAKPMPK